MSKALSPKGRRPPYYDPFRTFAEIDEAPLEHVEIFANSPQLSHFLYEYPDEEDAVRRWNEEHEKVIAWFYDPSGPVLVNPRFPTEHLDYCNENATAARARARTNVIRRCCILAERVLMDNDLERDFISTWRALSPSEQESLCLRVLSTLARAEEASDVPGVTGPIARIRKLIPEITVSNLCADGGNGFVDFLNLMVESALNPERLDTHPIPNSLVFRKLGIVDQTHSLPLSKADRCFQESFIQQRHSLLFKLTGALLDAISGQPIDITRNRLTGFRSEITASNIPHLADIKDPKLREESARKYVGTCDEVCANCFKNSGHLGLKHLLYCERCKRVGRIQPYCSRVCQEGDWQRHKNENCGSPISSFHLAPVFTADSPTTASPVSPTSWIIRAVLDDHPTAIWAARAREPGTDNEAFSVEMMPPTLDPAQSRRITAAMRPLAFRALDGDRKAISLFAYSRIRQVTRCHDANGPAHKPLEGSSNDTNELTFREMFRLSNEKDWDDALAEGKLEIEKPENERVKEHFLLFEDYINYYARQSRAPVPPALLDLLRRVPLAKEPDVDDITRELSKLLVGSRHLSNRSKIKALYGI